MCFFGFDQMVGRSWVGVIRVKSGFAVGAGWVLIAVLVLVSDVSAQAPRSVVTFPVGSSRVMTATTSSVPTLATPFSAGTVCPKCGRVHSSNAARVVRSVPAASSKAVVRSVGGVQNVLSALNSQRSRQGLPSLRFDATLQAVAARRAQQMASMGLKSHPPGSYAPGTHEGVGWSSSYAPGGVLACYTSDPNLRVAGAAMARGRDGVYFAVVYR